MRIGQMRGVTLAAGFITALLLGQTTWADGFGNTIPREVLAQDLNTGQPYFAPPIPWGHYAKDGLFDHYYPKAGHFGFLHHGCKSCGNKLCGGKGCGNSGGKCGLFGHGCGKGEGCGGLGCGNGGSGLGCGHSAGSACGDPGCGLGHGRRIKDCGLCKNKGCGFCRSSSIGDPIYVTATSQSPPPPTIITPTAQVVDPNGFVGGPTSLCDGCVGKGCGKCGGCGLLHKGNSDPCGGCGTKGCGGKCGLFNHGGGDGCGACGGKGCGKCGLFSGGNGCKACGGRGCSLCSGLKNKLAGLLHHKQGQIKYFVGPGGPVPLTPGYVPYTITTRSPRDFLAFPPYTPSEF